MKVNARQFHETIARMEAQRKAARHEALRVIGLQLISWVRWGSPLDTARFLRGYQIAFQQIGHLDGPVAELNRSIYIAQAIKLLVGQFDWWSGVAEKRRKWLIERYPNGAPRGRRAVYNKARRGLVKAQKLATRAREELEKYRSAPYGIIMSPLRWSYDTEGLDGRQLVTVRPTPYGGRGVLVDRPTRTQARIINLEPHAAFVERNHGTTRTAFQNAVYAGDVPRKSAERYFRGMKTAASVQGAARERFLAGK